MCGHIYKKKYIFVIFGRFKRKNSRAVGSNRRILDRNVVVVACAKVANEGTLEMSCSRLGSDTSVEKNLEAKSHKKVLDKAQVLTSHLNFLASKSYTARKLKLT